MRRKARMTVQLPPTPVTPEMREKVVAVAEQQQRSIADVMRQAVSLFLSSIDSKAITDVSKPIIEREVQS